MEKKLFYGLRCTSHISLLQSNVHAHTHNAHNKPFVLIGHIRYREQLKVTQGHLQGLLEQ